MTKQTSLIALLIVIAVWFASGYYHTEKDATRLSDAFLQGVEAGKGEVCDDMEKLNYNLAMAYC